MPFNRSRCANCRNFGGCCLEGGFCRVWNIALSSVEIKKYNCQYWSPQQKPVLVENQRDMTSDFVAI